MGGWVGGVGHQPSGLQSTCEHRVVRRHVRACARRLQGGWGGGAVMPHHARDLLAGGLAQRYDDTLHGAVHARPSRPSQGAHATQMECRSRKTRSTLFTMGARAPAIVPPNMRLADAHALPAHTCSQRPDSTQRIIIASLSLFLRRAAKSSWPQMAGVATATALQCWQTHPTAHTHHSHGHNRQSGPADEPALKQPPRLSCFFAISTVSRTCESRRQG